MLPSFLRTPFLLCCGLGFALAAPALAADHAAASAPGPAEAAPAPATTGTAETPASGNDWLAPSRFAINLKYTGLTYHPGGGENEEHYKRSLDGKDFWVLQVGAQADVDYAVNRFFYLRSANALYRDCSDLWAGFHHFGFRANWDVLDRVSLRIGIGPTYLWRQNWFGKVKGYTKDSFFGPATEGAFQHAFIWYGGDADVEWKVWDKVSLLYSVIPGYPEVIQSSVGLRYRF